MRYVGGTFLVSFSEIRSSIDLGHIITDSFERGKRHAEAMVSEEAEREEVQCAVPYGGGCF